MDSQRDLRQRYGLDFDEPLDWAILVDRAAATGCVDDMLELQGLMSIQDADRLLRQLAAEERPADFPALIRAAVQRAA